jgi:predicted transcriptional regulator
MEIEEFKKILKENELTQRKFSELSGIKYSTCTKWGKDNRPVSDWVESWLTLYIENQRLKVLANKVKSMCEEVNK